MEISDYLKNVAAVVEATGFEIDCLHERHPGWERPNMGKLVRVGNIGDGEIWISLYTSQIGDRKVLFYEATGRVADYDQIDRWMATNLPPSAFRNGRVNRFYAKDFEEALVA